MNVNLVKYTLSSRNSFIIPSKNTKRGKMKVKANKRVQKIQTVQTILDIKKITKPTWKHNAGFGINHKTGRFRKQKILGQATTPEDPQILSKLKISKKDKVLAIAAYYASWASKIKEAGADVVYSDISRSMVNYAKKHVKIRFSGYIQSNYELIPKETNEYDWTFTFEACGGEQGLPIAFLRSLLNKKGGILVYYDRKKEERVRIGGKPRTYPKIVKTLAKLYSTKFLIKQVYFKGHVKGHPISQVKHMVFWIFTNQRAQKLAFLDLKIIDLISKKRAISIKQESKVLKIPEKELKDSLNRLFALSWIIKQEFMKRIVIK